METKAVFEQTLRLGDRLKELGKEIDSLNQSCLRLMTLCPHEIVFKYTDNHPKEFFIDGNYYCPACSKTIKLFQASDIKESPFKESRIIPLTNLSLLGTDFIYFLIRIEVFFNIDIYYNKNISIEELTKRMENVLKDDQYDYTPPHLLIKK